MKKIIYSFCLLILFGLISITYNSVNVYASTFEYVDNSVTNENIDYSEPDEYSINLTSSGDNNYYWENTGESLPKAIDYEDENLLKYLKKGDIIFEAMSAVNHSAIVEGVYYDSTYEQYYVRVIESVKDGGVCRGIVTPERMETKEGSVYRLTNVTEEQIDGAFEFIYDQLGKKYEVAVHKNYESENNDWYCSELIWAAYYHQGIYLDNDDNNQFGSIVWPSELVDHDFAKMIVSYEEETICTSVSSTEHKIECGDDELTTTHNYKSYNGYIDKCYGCNKLSSSETIYSDFGFLNCRSESLTDTVFCNAGEFLICEISIDCTKSYYFNIMSFSGINVSLYKANQNVIDINVNNENNGCTASFSQYLNEGVYYLRVNFIDINSSSNIIITSEPTWQSYGTEVGLGENQIHAHLHTSSNNYSDNLVYFINTSGPDFYKFSIEATKADGSVVAYLYTSLKVYNHMNEYQEDKYIIDGYSELAQSIDNNNYLYMYLERNGYYYIHVNMPDASYTSVKLNIERVSVEEIEVASRFDEVFTETLINSNDMTEYATGFSIDQTSVFTIDVTTSQTYTGNITFILFRKAYNNDTKEYYIDEVVGDYIPLESDELRKILVEGTYYIGFFGNTSNVPVTVIIDRIVNTSEITDQVLIMDPSYALPYGTEVRHNKGGLGGTTITEGFTRHVHFQNVTGVPSVERQDYNFYSSNNSYATVSEFGTVFAKSVSQDREVTITAVYKYNPAIIFTIDLEIKNDTSNTPKLIETTQTIYLSDFVGGKYKLVLDENNSPYPWIQYFNWLVYVPCQKDDILVTMDYYGFLTTTGVGSATLTGEYIIDPNVTIIIHINFVE